MKKLKYDDFLGMSRLAIILVLLFIGLDAGVCPVVCLATDAASHQASGVPSQGSGLGAACGGMCWSGVTGHAIDSSVVLMHDCSRIPEGPVALPSRSPVANIDHPPRLA